VREEIWKCGRRSGSAGGDLGVLGVREEKGSGRRFGEGDPGAEAEM
jgi:hypothetical protein